MLVKAIVDHMPRVRTLHILDRDLEYLIANTPTAPRLRSLLLHPEADNDSAIAPSVLLTLWAPNLRYINLYRSRVVWKELLWSDLEYLRIDTDYRVQEPSMEEIFTVLQASPRLRTLYLK